MPINVDKKEPLGFFATVKQSVSDLGTISTNLLGGLAVATKELSHSSDQLIVRPIGLAAMRTESFMNLKEAEIKVAMTEEAIQVKSLNKFQAVISKSAMYEADIMAATYKQYLGNKRIEPELLEELGLTSETTEEATSNGGNRQSNIANILANEEE